ncbi:MAG: RNA polymerase sigma factor [Planctomycetota bacterium]
MIEDKLLVWELNRGSADALRRIYDKHRDDLLRLAATLLHDTSSAEDVVQDAFVSFAESAGRFRLRRNLKGYLTTCVANRARNVNRAMQVRQTSGSSEPHSMASDGSSPVPWIIRNEQFDKVSDAIRLLPQEQREAVTLHLQGQMKFREIAKLQRVSVKTAQSRYRYGLEKLRSAFNSEAEK